MDTKKFLLIVLIFLFFQISSFAHGQLNICKKPQFCKNDIENLLDKRRIILNDAFFNDLKLEKMFEKLILIEKSPILEEDINFVKTLNENPTDLAYVNSLRISKVESIKKIKASHEYEIICTILWEIKYGTEETIEECLYKISIQEKSGSLYLNKLQPVIDN